MGVIVIGVDVVDKNIKIVYFYVVCLFIFDIMGEKRFLCFGFVVFLDLV